MLYNIVLELLKLKRVLGRKLRFDTRLVNPKNAVLRDILRSRIVEKMYYLLILLRELILR